MKGVTRVNRVSQENRVTASVCSHKTSKVKILRGNHIERHLVDALLAALCCDVEKNRAKTRLRFPILFFLMLKIKYSSINRKSNKIYLILFKDLLRIYYDMHIFKQTFLRHAHIYTKQLLKLMILLLVCMRITNL